MPGSLKINRIKFKAGAGPGQAPLEIIPNTVVILVGPNNSGKSLALREIENWCFGKNEVTKVVDTLNVDFPTVISDAENLINEFKADPPVGQANNPGHIWAEQYTFRKENPTLKHQVNLTALNNAVQQQNNNDVLRQWLSAFYTIRLDGRTRFSLAESKPSGDLLQAPQNHLWKLFSDDSARTEVRRLTAEAFGLYFTIDPTGMTQFKIRMSSRPPADNSEEQSLDARARTFHSSAFEIKEYSDGVQAFVGLTSALLSLPHKIILIDEPEAFLHPPLARRLGGNIARLANSRAASLIVSTHSSEFLFGCIETVANTIVVRLTYDSNTATARALSETELQNIAKDPLLRSTGTLRALFHRAAIITEGDTDRAFYDEINGRLLAKNRGIKEAMFINAQNKQTIFRIVGPLRKIGIPAVAILDLDIIKCVSTNWSNLINACQLPANLRQNIEQERDWLKQQLVGKATATLDPFKKGGIDNLDNSDKQRANSFLELMRSYGLFIVPKGEIESWLSDLGVLGHGTDWLINIFSSMGQTEADTGYLFPGTDDVWKFIDDINGWVENQNRLGVG